VGNLREKVLEYRGITLLFTDKTLFMKKNLSPIQVLAVGFVLISLLGGIVLYLPISSSTGNPTPFLDALFTATSAVTTTGLIVVDTGSHYNLLGQTVILILFQVGGLGYMLFFGFFSLLMGRKLSMQDTLLLIESIKRPLKIDVAKFVKITILYSFFSELFGVFALTLYFIRDFELPQAIYSAVFHSISAFNTAGFSIYADSFSQHASSIPLNIILILISIAGCLGFWVILDSFEYIRKKIAHKTPNRLSSHSKIVYLLTLVFFIAGTITIYFSEQWGDSLSIGQKIINSSFQTFSATSTTGFNTIDIGRMSETSLFLIIGFMFVGSGSGGTAGGIKITTFGILLSLLYSVLRQKEDVNIFKRRVVPQVVRSAVVILLLGFLWAFFTTIVLSATEKGTFLQILFEVVSALGTVGLSTGITGNLTFVGKFIIIVTMLIGRIGPLGVGLAILKKQPEPFHYSEEAIFVG
jgi:trk system potassium uptake protein